MSNITPGPWRITWDKDFPEFCNKIVLAGKSTRVAEQVRTADAQLIASAPDLLATLQRTTLLISAQKTLSPLKWEKHRQEILKEALEIIKKAKGEL